MSYYPPIPGTAVPDDCICGEINARHCPVHNDPIAIMSFDEVMAALGRDPNTGARTAKLPPLSEYPDADVLRRAAEIGVAASPSEELVKAAQRLIDNEDRLANQVAIMSSEKARQAALLDIRAALAALRTTKEGEPDAP